MTTRKQVLNRIILAILALLAAACIYGFATWWNYIHLPPGEGFLRAWFVEAAVANAPRDAGMSRPDMQRAMNITARAMDKKPVADTDSAWVIANLDISNPKTHNGQWRWAFVGCAESLTTDPSTPPATLHAIDSAVLPIARTGTPLEVSEAGEVLANLHDRRAIPYLQKDANVDDDFVRKMIRESLSRLGATPPKR